MTEQRKADQMSEAPELKPCPFCGGEASERNAPKAPELSRLAFWVECQECETEGPISGIYEMAITAWNTRPLYDAQAKVIEAAEEALENLLGHFDTPIVRRKSGFQDVPQWLADARDTLAALQENTHD